jgi:hypothetical protein
MRLSVLVLWVFAFELLLILNAYWFRWCYCDGACEYGREPGTGGPVDVLVHLDDLEVH